MSLNEVASAERIHIGFYGMCNAGKSSLVNALTGQSLSVVSPVRGTTTDPVKKAMELLPLGPVVILDTPGLDDTGELGTMRVEQARRMLARTNIAVLVVDAAAGMGEAERWLLQELRERKIPCVVALNKADLLTHRPDPGEDAVYVSAVTGEGVGELKERLGRFAAQLAPPRLLVRDLLDAGDLVVLVTPIDASAPKGRLILPQQLVLRDVLDAHGTAVVCQVEELQATLAALGRQPRMVITDSQAFGAVAALVPEKVPLTSFSILMARYKGELLTQVQGFAALRGLRDGDRVLISEGCTHHRQCGDIGTVKLPAWIRRYTGAEPAFTFTAGGDFPQELAGCRLIVHCGGCMLNEAEMKHRISSAVQAGVPVVNYGVAIAGMQGVLQRSLTLFPEALALLK